MLRKLPETPKAGEMMQTLQEFVVPNLTSQNRWNTQASVTRALCSGKTLAFQANDAGSIPAARSKNLPAVFRQVSQGIAFAFRLSCQARIERLGLARNAQPSGIPVLSRVAGGAFDACILVHLWVDPVRL